MTTAIHDFLKRPGLLLLGACLILQPLALFAVTETRLVSEDGMTNYLYTPTATADPNKTYWLVIGVHGLGGNGRTAQGISDWAERYPDVVVLGPSFAQRRLVKSDDGAASNVAYAGKETYALVGPIHEAKIKELIEKTGKDWKLKPKYFLFGFSAGAQFVHRYAFRYPEKVAGVSAHSAGAWAEETGEDAINLAAKSIPFAVSCGESDKGSSRSGGPPRIEGIKKFAETLKKLGFAVELRTWPNVEHTLTPDARAFGRELFDKIRESQSSSP